jgi:hypothetical protein
MSAAQKRRKRWLPRVLERRTERRAGREGQGCDL